MRLGCDHKYKWTRPSANVYGGKEQPNNIANLPNYTVHSRGATKPPAPESPRTACSLSCHYTVLLLGGVTLGHLAL